MFKAALAAGGTLIALALGLGIPALLQHAEERQAWAAERQKQGTDHYDPAVSDAHYRASRGAWQRSALPGHLLGAGFVLFTLGALGRDAPATGGGDAGRLARATALLIDLGLTGALGALHGLDAGESAAVRALAAAAPWLAALPLSARIVGARSPGMRALGLRG